MKSDVPRPMNKIAVRSLTVPVYFLETSASLSEVTPKKTAVKTPTKGIMNMML
jgi:hypothetical protein